MSRIAQYIRSYRLFQVLLVASVCASTMILALACGEEASPTTVPKVSTTAPEVTAETPSNISDADPLTIVATSNIVGEWVSIVGGEKVDVVNLVPRGVDPHGYQPGARDIAGVADAEVVFAVGLSLEREWLEDLVENAAADHDVVIELGERIDPIEFSFEDEDDHGDEEAEEEGEDHGDEEGDTAEEEGEHHDEDDEGMEEEEGEHHDEDDEDMEDVEGEHHDEDDEDVGEEEGEHHDEDDEDMEEEEGEHHDEDDEDMEEEEGEHHDEDDVEIHREDDGHGHGSLDPHFWFDPKRVVIAVGQIAKELRTVDPESADYYNANRDAYIRELEELDMWVVDSVSTIDDHDRLLVTTHDSFGYFAERYGFEIAGVIIPGGGTELERSPQELANLVEEVEEVGATVVFAEAQLSDRLANTLAREAGIRIVGGLHVGSLGADDSGAATYLELIRSNVGIIVGALEE